MFSRPFTGLLALTGLVSLATLPGAALAAPGLSPVTQLSADADARRLLSVQAPPCKSSDCWPDGVQPTPQGIGLRTVYLNFDGVTLTSTSNGPDDATSNRTWMINSVVSPGNTLTIPPFNWNDLGSLSGANNPQEIIDYTLAELRSYHQPYNVQFTTTRPSSGTYHMVVFGGSCAGVVGSSCAGIAPLDCNDFSPSNIVFAFPGGLRAVDLAPTAAQELAHAFGLSHTYDTSDIMYPQIQSSLPEGYGAGAIPPEDQGPCGNGSYQDSHAKLLSIVGSQGEDGTPPSVLITSPSNGDVIEVGTPIEANIIDDSAIVKVELILNNQVMGSKSGPPFDFKIPANAPLGQVRVELEATDAWDNVSGHRVTVYIGTGDEEPCNNGQCPAGKSCAEDNLCYSDDPGSSGALGDVCSDNDECDSSTCATVGEESRCSQTCTADTSCPDGFECLSDTACWPKKDGGEPGLCSLSGSGPGALSTLGFLLFAIVFSGRRRRSQW